jgi:hypothetical protein
MHTIIIKNKGFWISTVILYMIIKVHLFHIIVNSKYNKYLNESFIYRNNHKNHQDDEHKINKLKFYFNNLNRTGKQIVKKYSHDEESKLKEDDNIVLLTNEKLINSDEDVADINVKFNLFKIFENDENDNIYEKYYRKFVTFYINNFELIEKFFKFESNMPTIDDLDFDKLNQLPTDNDSNK